MTPNNDYVELVNDVDTYPFSTLPAVYGMTGSPKISSSGNIVTGNADVNFLTKGSYLTITVTGVGLTTTITLGDGTHITDTFTDSTGDVNARATALYALINANTNYVATNLVANTFNVYSPRIFDIADSATNATITHTIISGAKGQFTIRVGDYIFAKAAKEYRQIIGINEMKSDSKHIVVDSPFTSPLAAIDLLIVPRTNKRQVSVANTGAANGEINGTPFLIGASRSVGVENNIPVNGLGFIDPVVLDATGTTFKISYFN